MSLHESLLEILTPVIEDAGFFLEQVQVTNPGSHRIVTCVVDGPKPLNLDEVTVVSRLISEILDESTLIDDSFTSPSSEVSVLRLQNLFVTSISLYYIILNPNNKNVVL